GLHPRDAFGRQRTRAHQIFGVPLSVDVVRDRRDLVTRAEQLAQRFHQCGLAGADRSTDPNTQRAMRAFHPDTQLRKRRVYCVSWCIGERWARRAEVATSSIGVESARVAAATKRSSSAAISRWPSVCPSGISRTPADTRFAAIA